MSLIGRINNNLKLTTMRKFLRLSLVCLMAMVCGNTFAQQTATFDFTGDEAYGMKLLSGSTQEYNTDPYVCKEGDVTLTLNGRTRWWNKSGNKTLRVYKSASLNISVTSNYIITKVTTNGSKNFSTKTGDYTNGTWTGSAKSVDLTYTGSSTGDITTIEVTYEEAPDDFVEAPTITGTTPFEGSTEIIITGGEGTTIYYTTDGTDPTTATTTKGTSPVKFTIDKSTTVKAIAEKNGNVSTVASKEFTKVEFADMTIADLYKLDAPQENINLTINDGKVVHVNGTDVYVRDGEYAILFYHTNKLKLNKNATVSGTVKVDFTIHNGLYEVKENNFTNTSALKIEDSKEEALPLNATIQDIATDGKYMNNLVKIENVKITSEVSGKYTNYYATNGTDKIQLYGADDVVEKYANDETEYNITAVVSMYNKAQLLPVSVETATGITDVTVDEFDENAPIYNLSGQRVDKNAKGILIQNGKKFIRR